MAEDQGPVIILDVSAIVHRFYHALPRLEALDGTPVQALYGLANVLLRIIHEYQPRQIFACLDRPETTERERAYADYKATRPATADDLRTQLNRVGELLTAFGVPIFEQPGYEADDLIGTLVTKIRARGDEIFIVTGDLDTLQLVESGVTVLILRKGFSEVGRYDEAAVHERYGIAPTLLPDLKALVGDQSDNIVGLPGIGEKRGAALIEQLGPIEAIIINTAAIKESKTRAIVEAHIDRLQLNKQLTTIVRDLPVTISTEPYSGLDSEHLIPFLRSLNFKSIIERLERMTGATPAAEPAITLTIKELDQAKLRAELATWPDLIVAIIQDDALYLQHGDVAYRTTPDFELIEQLLIRPGPAIIFDLKTFLRRLSARDPLFDRHHDLGQVTDLKLLFSLVHSNVPAVDLARLVNLSTTRTYSGDTDRLADFFTLAPSLTTELRAKAAELALDQVWTLERQLTPVLTRMEFVGLRLNRAALAAFKAALETRLARIEAEAHQLVGETFNLASPVALRGILFERLKLSPKTVAKTKKGAFSTQESELEKLRDAHPLVPLILEHRELAKLRSTYTDSLTKAVDPTTERLHTSFEQLGSSTGRITSQAPNLQNIPVRGELAADLRRCFEAEPGWVFLGLDYSQIELRLAAHLSGDEAMIAAFQAGLDIHSITAKLLFRSDDEAHRRMAKTVSFGIIYGMSAAGLAERLRLSRTEAQTIINGYFARFPGLKKFCDEMIAQARARGYTETMFGRKRIIPELNSRSYRERAAAERAAINAPLQGANADLMKRVLVATDTYLIDEKLFPDQARIVLQVYDQLVLEVRAATMEPVRERVQQIMETAATLKVPLIVKVRTGKNFAEL